MQRQVETIRNGRHDCELLCAARMH